MKKETCWNCKQPSEITHPVRVGQSTELVCTPCRDVGSYSPARDWRRSVLDVAQSLHGQVSGSGGFSHPDQTVEGELLWLKEQVRAWTLGSPAFICYDSAVLALVKAAIEEGELWVKTQGGHYTLG